MPKEEQKEEAKKDEARFDKKKAQEAADAVVTALGLTPGSLVSSLKDCIAKTMRIKTTEVSDKMVWTAITRLSNADRMVETLRSLGIVPRPGFWSALTGWHDIEHMRARGFTNKVAGGTALAAKMACLVYGALKAYEYYAR